MPAFNEAEGIAALIGELRALRLEGADLEIVVVDDGSSDRTRAEARAVGARVVSLPYNLGIGLAVQTGFHFALAHGADFIVQVDGDGQHVPEEIPRLLKVAATGTADVVVGSRFAQGTAGHLEATTLLRWLAGRLLAWTIRLLTGRKIQDTTSGFRLFNRRAAELVAHEYPDDYPEVQVLVTLARLGFRIEETQVRMRPRRHGRSSINWWRAVYYVFKVTLASIVDKARSGPK